MPAVIVANCIACWHYAGTLVPLPVLLVCWHDESLAMNCNAYNAHLYEEEISTGVFAATQSCCQPDLHSSTEQEAIVFRQSQCGIALLLTHCKTVRRAKFHRCFPSNTVLLSA